MSKYLTQRPRKINGTVGVFTPHPDEVLQSQGLSISAITRFFEKVNKTETCWLWTSACTNTGPVMCRGAFGSGYVTARRISWMIYYGTAPTGRIFNGCGNVLCVNPEHLKLRGGEKMPPIDWNRAKTLCEEKIPEFDCNSQDPTLPEGFNKTFRERFWAKVNKTESCWLWTGSINEHGYGMIGKGQDKDGNTIHAHIASWLMHKSPIPEGLCVCHDCPGGDNRACVNPDHLWLGTTKENLEDAIIKYRTKHGRAWNSRLTIEQVREIRTRHKAGETIGELSRQFGISRTHISKLVNYLSWKDCGLI